jgi:hypothetical protein
MPEYLFEVHICDEFGHEILTVSAPCRGRKSKEGPEPQFAAFQSVVSLLRMMKHQKGRRGTARWEFNINSESPKAELFAKMLRMMR